MDCRRAQAAFSARMDGERLSPRLLAAADRHVGGCPRCEAFARGAWRLREAARFQLAAVVPDLVDPIMAAVAEEAPSPGGAPATRPPPLTRPRHRPRLAPRLVPRLAPAVAAIVAGAVVGSLSVGGPWQRAGTTPIAAADVARGVAAAAPGLDAYQARFAVTEWHFAPEVPVRELALNVWFKAPQHFRLDVTDHTQYPSGAWTPTDLSLVVNGSSWYSAGLPPCPSVPQECPPRRTLVRHHVAFSPSTPAPTDLVLPITTLADANGLDVIGRGTVMGRDAVEVVLPFERATPLFPFLRLGGSWRPFFPEDRVVLWLDARNWFPLRYEVFPAQGRARYEWALRFGLPEEPPGRAVFDATALSVDEGAPAPGTFETPPGGGKGVVGAEPMPLSELAREIGRRPLTPTALEGLSLYRADLAPAPQSAPETLITYTKGLSWLKLGETRGWTGSTLYGPVGPEAQQVPLPNGGVAYYEPATEDRGRRLSIHAEGIDLYLETNLPRSDLIQVADSLPVVGQPLPVDWRVRRSPDGETERVPLDRAIRELPFPVEIPGSLPPGYGLASAELIRVGGEESLNVYFQQATAAVGDGPIRLHAEAAHRLPPASSAAQWAVAVRGQEGRWTPQRHQLEWVQDGVYYSIDAPNLELADLLGVAGSLRPAEATGQETP